MKTKTSASDRPFRLAPLLALALLAPAPVPAAWFDSPRVAATVNPNLAATDPHYVNLSEDGAFLLVDWHSQNTALPVQLYAVAELAAASGATNRLAMASALAGDFFGAGTGSGGWKGGAVSATLGVAIPGSGKSSGALYTAFSVPAFGWKADETAFALSGFGDAGFDGLDFNAAGTRLYANQYASGGRNRILAYDTSALKSAHTLSLLATKTVEGVTRIRNLSCYTVQGRDLVYFGEGAVSGSNNSVYVYDPAEDAVTALVTDAALFDDDIMNVKLSHVASGCPTLYVQTDNGRLHVFLLAPDGKSVTSARPARSFTPAECAALCGLSGVPSNASYVKFRNFEVTDDGETAFFLHLNSPANGVASPGLCVVKSSSSEDPYVSCSPAYTTSGSGNVLFTDYFFGANSRIEVDYAYNDETCEGFVFSPWEEGSGSRSGIWRQGSTYRYFAGNKASIAGPSGMADTVRRTQCIDAAAKKGYIVTGTTTNETDLSAATFSTANWPVLFLGSASGSTGALRVNTTHYARARIYSAKIYESGVLVRDYAPAIVNGVPCLYDRANGSVAADTRDGVAQPGFGGDVLRLAGEPYLELSRTDGQAASKGIDTGYHMGNASRVEVDFSLPDPANDSRPFGAWNGGSTVRPLAWINNRIVKYFLNTGTTAVNTGVLFDGERQTFCLDATDMTFRIARDGIVQSATVSSGSAIADGVVADRPLALFADANSADGSKFQSAAIGMKCYSARLLEGGVPVTNFLPFVSVDGPCLRDALSGGVARPLAPRYFAFRIEAAPAAQAGYVVKTTNEKNAGFLTDWQLDARSRVACDFALGTTANGQRPFGAWNNFNSGIKLRSLIYTTGGNIQFFINSGSASFTAAATDTAWHEYVMDFTTPTAPTGSLSTAGALVKSGAGTAISAATDRGSVPVSIFADNNGSGTFAEGCQTGARFRGMRAYEAGALVHDWIPATKDGAVGVADRLTGVFLSGGANFDGAGDLWEATSDAYVESAGGMVLDTGYHARKTSRIEVDMMPLSNGQACFFGAYGGNNGQAYTLWREGAYVRYNMVNTAGDADYRFHPKGIRFTGVVDFENQTQYVKLGGTAIADYTADFSSATIPDDWTSRNALGVCGSINDAGICTGPAPAAMRVYAVRIYEEGALVRLFLPYSGEDGVGLRCALTGAKAFKHAASTGEDPVYVAGPSAVAAADIAALAAAGAGPADFGLGKGAARTAVADFPGATSYRWTRNGAFVGETADGALGIGWRSHTASDVFTVTPVYATADGEVLGAPAAFTVTYHPAAFVLIVR